jgi:hypothetical protein
MLRSILAVVAGYLFIPIVSFALGFTVIAAFPDAYTPTGYTDNTTVLLLTMVYVAITAIAGCYLTARLAPRDPMKHALILGLLGVITQAAMWAFGPQQAPTWFYIASLLLVMPYAWIGGRIREKQLERGGAPAIATA